MIKYFISIGFLFFGTGLFAANGSHLTSVSATAAGMGGSTLATFVGDTEALYRNPAWLGYSLVDASLLNGEVNLGIGKHNGQAAVVNGSSALPPTANSNDTIQLLPNIAASMKIAPQVNVGVGFISYGGSSVDYTGNASFFEIKSQQQLFRILPSVSYAPIENLRLGASVVVGISRIAMNAAIGSAQSNRDLKTSTGVGGQLGIVYSPTPGLHFAVTALSQTSFSYDELFPISAFGPTPNPAKLDSVRLQEPMEFAAGVSYQISDFTFSLEARNIRWAEADGYKDLGWDNKNALALGAQYRLGPATLRTGFNYSKSPTLEKTNANGNETYDFQGTTVLRGAVDQQNLYGFNATSEFEWDLGAGYEISANHLINLGLSYAFPNTVNQNGVIGASAAPYAVQAKSSGWSIVAGYTLKM